MKEKEIFFARAIELTGRRLFLYTHNKTKATKFYNMLKSGELFQSKEAIEATQKRDLTNKSREIFRPWKLIKKCDKCNQGGNNTSGCNQVRQVQNLWRYERGLLPSKTPIVEAGEKLEVEASKYNDWELVRDTLFGEMACYKSFDMFIVNSFIAYGIDEVAQVRLVGWGFSADGEDVTHLHKQTSSGSRPLDLDTRDPITNDLLFHNSFSETGGVMLKNIILRK